MGFFKKIYRITFFMIIIQLILIFYVFNDNTFDIQKQQQQLNLKLNYNGIVTDKFIDKFEHSWPVIVLKNEKKIYVPENIYNKIKIKDSIFKKKESLVLMVLRGSQLIKLPY